MSVREFCPRCQSLRSMVVRTAQREEVDAEGKSKTILVKSYDCENCGLTVRSEELGAVKETGDSDTEEPEQQATEEKPAADKEPN